MYFPPPTPNLETWPQYALQFYTVSTTVGQAVEFLSSIHSDANYSDLDDPRGGNDALGEEAQSTRLVDLGDVKATDLVVVGFLAP